MCFLVFGRFSLGLLLVDFAVNLARLHEFFVRAGSDDFSAVHDEDFVGAFHRRDALRNDDFRGIGNFFRKRLSDQSIRLGIDRRSRIVENEHFGFSQKGAGDTEPLLLTAGYVGSSLFDIRIVAVGERANEFICLS